MPRALRSLLPPLVALSLATLAACAGQSRPARMQEAAIELNVNARFGRMELAAEHVGAEARQAFFERRKAWGSRVRVVDSELVGVRFDKDEAEALVLVRVAWQPADSTDMRVTTVRQQFKDSRTTGWRLVKEEVAEGDVGLFGERPSAPQDAPAPVPQKSRFDTVRLGQSGGATRDGTVDEAP